MSDSETSNGTPSVPMLVCFFAIRSGVPVAVGISHCPHKQFSASGNWKVDQVDNMPHGNETPVAPVSEITAKR